MSEFTKNIVGPGTNVLLQGPGRLMRINLNKNTGTSIAIYDNVQSSPPLLGTLATVSQTSLEYNCTLHNGLTLVTLGNVDITVFYRD